MVTDTIPIFSIFSYTLFDIGVSRSFVSHFFVSKLSVIVEPLDVEFLNDTSIEGEMANDNVCKSCIIVIENRVLPANLIVLSMHDFDVIFGMD